MFYWIVRGIVKVIFFVIFRVKVEGLENMPKDGAAIVCANHINLLDPVFVGIVIKRQINYIAKKELFKNKAIGWFLQQMKAIPTERGTADMASYKATIKLLKNDEVLGIFAQGTRIKEIDAQAAKGGVALFALKTGAVVVPAGISGSYGFMRRIKIKFGEPISLKEYENEKIKSELLSTLASQIMDKVSELTK